MPSLTGPTTGDGAVIDILVGVNAPGLLALRQTGSPIPQPVPMRAVLDTGSKGGERREREKSRQVGRDYTLPPV